MIVNVCVSIRIDFVTFFMGKVFKLKEAGWGNFFKKFEEYTPLSAIPCVLPKIQIQILDIMLAWGFDSLRSAPRPPCPPSLVTQPRYTPRRLAPTRFATLRWLRFAAFTLDALPSRSNPLRSASLSYASFSFPQLRPTSLGSASL